jgi:hypothetical protein
MTKPNISWIGGVYSKDEESMAKAVRERTTVRKNNAICHVFLVKRKI